MKRLVGALVVAQAMGCGSGVTAADAESSGAAGTGAGASTSTSTSTSGDSASGTGGNATGGTGGSGGSGGGPVECQAPADAAAFEVGTGETCFARIDPGAVPLISGPQGGYHVWVAFGCASCDATSHLRWGARDPSTGADLLGTAPSEGMVQLKGQSWPQAAGIFLFMPGFSYDPEYPPLPKGTPFTVWAELIEGTTVMASAEVTTKLGDTLVWDPCAEHPEDPNCGFDGGG